MLVKIRPAFWVGEILVISYMSSHLETNPSCVLYCVTTWMHTACSQSPRPNSSIMHVWNYIPLCPSQQYMGPGRARHLSPQYPETQVQQEKIQSPPAIYLPSLSCANPSSWAQGVTRVPPGSKGSSHLSSPPRLQPNTLPSVQGPALPFPDWFSRSAQALFTKRQDSAAAVGLSCPAILPF